MTLTQIIKEWLGEDEEESIYNPDAGDLLSGEAVERNQLRQELRTKLPELEKQIREAGYETDLTQPFDKGWKAGYQTAEHLCSHSNHLDGQAFVDAFLKELPDGKFYQWNDDIGVYKDLMNAVRRAANLTDLTEEETE